jgi:hypothetical protein
MAATPYAYQKAAVYAPGLIAEINADVTVSVDCQSVEWKNAGIAGTVVTMMDALTGPQKTALDAVVAAHSGVPPAPGNGIVSATVNATTTPAYSIPGTIQVLFVTNVPNSDFVGTLPTAASVGPGWGVKVMNSDGTCAANSTITVQRAGADTVNGATGYLLNAAYAALYLVSDGISKWTRMS